MRHTTRDRQARMLSELLERRHVTVRQLALDMDVSEATVRRDLRFLAEEKRVTLFHGGAAMPADGNYAFETKRDRNRPSKRLIGEIAASLVRDGDTIFLDSGTTCFEMAGPLGGRRGLSVIMNSARLALEFRAQGANLIMLGGQYRPDRMDTVGPIAQATLDQLRGYTAFIGADGISMDAFGVSASDIDSANLYRLAVQNARETVLVIDHSKFQSASLFKIVDWALIRRVVTDAAPSSDWREFLASRNIELHLPS
jgi:DeoR family transcriptional regulator, fructose operon transcriptional repressor